MILSNFREIAETASALRTVARSQHRERGWARNRLETMGSRPLDESDRIRALGAAEEVEPPLRLASGPEAGPGEFPREPEPVPIPRPPRRRMPIA